jgi:hypothetical protein
MPTKCFHHNTIYKFAPSFKFFYACRYVNSPVSKKKYGLVFAIFFCAFLFSYSMGAMYKMSDEQTEAFLNEFAKTTQGIGALGIFLHNMTDAIPMFIPAAGIGWAVYTAGTTGAAFSALASINPQFSHVVPITVLLGSPFGIMELVSYSIGMTRSFLLVFSIIKKNPLKKEIRPTLIEIGVVIALLLAAGITESLMVTKHI